MTYALIALNALTLVGSYLWLRRERAFWSQLVANVTESRENERLGWDSQRERLLDRIQAPEKAPYVEPEIDDRDHYISEQKIFEEELEAMEGPS